MAALLASTSSPYFSTIIFGRNTPRSIGACGLTSTRFGRGTAVGRDSPMSRSTGLRGAHIQNLDIPEIGRLLDHIDHAVQVMGVDYVGLGSDFDGISVLPRPMKDATSLPLLVAGLTARGYGDSELRKVLGGNFLRLL